MDRLSGRPSILGGMALLSLSNVVHSDTVNVMFIVIDVCCEDKPVPATPGHLILCCEKDWNKGLWRILLSIRGSAGKKAAWPGYLSGMPGWLCPAEFRQSCFKHKHF